MLESTPYVLPDGSYGLASTLPEAAIPITAEAYSMLEENPGMLNITVSQGEVYISPKLNAYAARAIEVVRTEVYKRMPSDSKLLGYSLSVQCSLGYFDEDTNDYLGADATREMLSALVKKSNDLKYLLHTYVASLNEASHVVQVDNILDDFNEAIGGIL